MTRYEWDKAFAPTPPVFSGRVEQTLRALEEEEPVKKFTIRTVLIAALIALLVLGVAYAVVMSQGQDWYYRNRFTNYQKREPEKLQAILDNLTTDVPQAQQGSALVEPTVQDVAWAPEQEIATFSLAIRPARPDRDELYSVWMLDADGSYADEIDPEDPESRAEHYLWTTKGFGLPQDVMDDPAKRLLFIDDGSCTIHIGPEGEAALPTASSDQFTGEDGAVIVVLTFDLNQLDADWLRADAEERKAGYEEGYGMSRAEWDAQIDESARYLLEQAERANAAIAANTDANGMLTLRYEYRVMPFRDGELIEDEASEGRTVFQIKIR